MGAPDLLAELMAPFVGGENPPERPKFAEFAAVRKPENNAGSLVAQGLSQNSQKSQGGSANSHNPTPPTAAQPAWRAPWSADDIAAYLARRERLMRWGWTEAEAEAVAERLTRRDQDGTDDRRACVDCRRFAFSASGHCTRHRAALLASPVIGRELATQPQRCPAHVPVARLDPSMAG
jgi:hypothetical protein